MPRAERSVKTTPLAPHGHEPLSTDCGGISTIPAKGLEKALDLEDDVKSNRSSSLELGETLPSRAELCLRKLETAYLEAESNHKILSDDLEGYEFEDEDSEEEELCDKIDEARQEKLGLKRAIQKHCREHDLCSTVLKDYERTYHVFEGTSSDHLNNLISEQINSLAQPEVVDVMNMVEKAYRIEGLQASGEEKQNSATILHEMICDEINLFRASLFEKKFEELSKILPEEEAIPSAALRTCFRSTLEDCKARLERLKDGNDQEPHEDEEPAPGILIFNRQLKTDIGEPVQTRKSALDCGGFDQRGTENVAGRFDSKRETVTSATSHKSVAKIRGMKRAEESLGLETDHQGRPEESKAFNPYSRAVSMESQRTGSSVRVCERPRWTTEHAETLLNAQCSVHLPICELKGLRTAIKIKKANSPVNKN